MTKVLRYMLKMLPAYAVVVGAWIAFCVFTAWVWTHHADALIVGACVVFLAVAWNMATAEEEHERSIDPGLRIVDRRREHGND